MMYTSNTDQTIKSSVIYILSICNIYLTPNLMNKVPKSQADKPRISSLNENSALNTDVLGTITKSKINY